MKPQKKPTRQRAKKAKSVSQEKVLKDLLAQPPSKQKPPSDFEQAIKLIALLSSKLWKQIKIVDAKATQSLKPFNLFFLQRKRLFLILLVTIAALYYSILKIQNQYSVDQPKTHLQVVADEGISVTRVFSRITYDKNGNDQLDIIVSLKGDTSKGKRVSIASPNTLHLARTYFLNNDVRRYTDEQDNSTWYHYEFINTGVQNISESFEGNMFGRNKQDMNLNYEVFIGWDSETTDKTSQDIFILNISEISLTSLFPEPLERTLYGIHYIYAPEVNKGSSYGILLGAIDRQSVYLSQFQLFVIGVIDGVLASIIASILLDIIKDIRPMRHQS